MVVLGNLFFIVVTKVEKFLFTVSRFFLQRAFTKNIYHTVVSFYTNNCSLPLSSLLAFILNPVSDEEGDEAELRDMGLLGGELQSDVVASESLRTTPLVSSILSAVSRLSGVGVTSMLSSE